MILHEVELRTTVISRLKPKSVGHIFGVNLLFQYLESAHFNGTRFLNPLHAPEGRSHFDLFKWLLKRKSSTWDKETPSDVASATPRVLPQNRPNAALNNWQVWFVGHATVLLQIGPYNFLTDPVWAEFVSPKQGREPSVFVPQALP